MVCTTLVTMIGNFYMLRYLQLGIWPGQPCYIVVFVLQVSILTILLSPIVISLIANSSKIDGQHN